MKYICPKCSRTICLIRSYLGWEACSIDPDTGDEESLDETGVDEVKEVRYQCNWCSWEGGEFYFQDKEEEEDDRKQ